jgi:hypothetical protein
VISGTVHLQTKQPHVAQYCITKTLNAADIFKDVPKTYASVSKEDQFVMRMTVPKFRQLATSLSPWGLGFNTG